MQIDLFLHMFLTSLKRFSKHKSIFMRTDLFSQETDIDRKAHRIEICRHFSITVMITALNDFQSKMYVSE